jgi:RND family efflux transporter MFP subunit
MTADASDDADLTTGRPKGTGRWLLLGAALLCAGALGWWGASFTQDEVWPDVPQAAALEPEGPAAAVVEAQGTDELSGRRQPASALATAVRGIVQPRREATIASRMTAVITDMPFREGQSFRAGALLARFDCSQTRAELNAARAAAAAYRSTYQQNAELDEYEAIGRNEVEVSRANLNRAEAEVQAINARLTDCAVYAPFAGTVVERIANVREVAASGQPLMRIQTGRDVELELIVPSQWLTWLGPGAAFQFRIDETGNTIRGEVTRLGASVDPVSRTIRVTARVTQSEGLILPGMSGSARFDDPRAYTGRSGDGQAAEGSRPATVQSVSPIAAPAAEP